MPNDEWYEKVGKLLGRAEESTESFQDDKKLAKKALSNIGSDLDKNMNIRVNQGLRDEFDKLCRSNDSTMSREIKRYMRLAVAAQKLIN